jgi:hypothetical protein
MKLRYKDLFYSPKSHYVLNYATLTIHDSEIRHLYNKALADNFDKLFCTTAVVCVFYTLIRVVVYLIGDLEATVRLGSTAIHIAFLLLWGLIRLRWKLQAPKIVFLYALTFLIQTNLSWRD